MTQDTCSSCSRMTQDSYSARDAALEEKGESRLSQVSAESVRNSTARRRALLEEPAAREEARVAFAALGRANASFDASAIALAAAAFAERCELEFASAVESQSFAAGTLCGYIPNESVALVALAEFNTPGRARVSLSPPSPVCPA